MVIDIYRDDGFAFNVYKKSFNFVINCTLLKKKKIKNLHHQALFLYSWSGLIYFRWYYITRKEKNLDPP